MTFKGTSGDKCFGRDYQPPNTLQEINQTLNLNYKNWKDLYTDCRTDDNTRNELRRLMDLMMMTRPRNPTAVFEHLDQHKSYFKRMVLQNSRYKTTIQTKLIELYADGWTPALEYYQKLLGKPMPQ
jgi:hypothetical protein